MSRPEPETLACTLDLEAMGPRLAEIQRLTAEHLRSHRVEGRTLHLIYDGKAVQEMTRVVELERACCAFLDFELKVAPDGVELAITAPEQDGSDAQWLFAQFLPRTGQPAQPASDASGCARCGG
jgi:hypothetical protein